jgi:hypothetical protein
MGILVIRQSIRGITEVQAAHLLDTLYTTILKRVEGGLSFQLASYGEYLAAESLAKEPLERIKQIAFDQRGAPNPSWLNAMSYLAELNAEVRNYFCKWHPLWMMNVSSSALSTSQRDEIVRSTLRILMSERLYAFNHPGVRMHRLAKLVTDAVKTDLFAHTLSSDEVEKGNALCLLGQSGTPEVIEQATQIAIDRTVSQQLRYSGLLALQNSHAVDTATRLLEALEEDDPLHLNIVDVIGTVATLDELPLVLPLLLSTQGMPASAYYRFQEMRSRSAVAALLRYASTHLQTINTMRAEIYFGPAFDAVPQHFDREFVELAASILSQVELRHIYVDRSGPLPKLFAGFRYLDDIQKEQLLQAFLLEVEDKVLNDGATFYSTSQPLSDLMTAGTLEWLITSKRMHMVPAIVRWLSGDFRESLAPYSDGMVEAQDAARDAYLLEERVRLEEASSHIDALQKSLLTRDELNGALTDFSDLTREHWPQLPEPYLAWLQPAVSVRMMELDLHNRIIWAGNTVTFPRELFTLLEVIAFYELHVDDPSAMVYALAVGAEDLVRRYFTRVPMTEQGVQSVLQMIENPQSPNALDRVINFICELKPLPIRIKQAVVEIASADLDRGHSQTKVFSLVADEQDVPWLEERRSHAQNAGVRYSAEVELIRRQHEPTLIAKLDAAIKDPASLGNEHYFPDRVSPEWLSKITSAFAWVKVTVLRERGLQLELFGVVSVCTDVLLSINRREAINVLKRQVKIAPTAWRIRQRSLILEQEQLLAIDDARLGPFENVLARLRSNTSSTRVKVWCEGVNDEQIFRILLERMSDAPIDVTVENVHGWPGLQQEKDPNAWLTECNEAFIIMDGDNGRKLKKHGRPLTPMARAELAKLRGFPITLLVLEKYGIENYLTQHAIEAMVGRDLSEFFPIPDDVPIRTHFASEKKTVSWKIRNLVARLFKLEAPSLPSFYPKAKNKEVAKYLQPDDLHGTDLFAILVQIVETAKRLQGDTSPDA